MRAGTLDFLAEHRRARSLLARGRGHAAARRDRLARWGTGMTVIVRDVF